MAAYGALPILHLTPDFLALVRTGTVYSLSVIYYEGMPKPAPMVHNGITHLENLYLEELAANQVYEFLLIVTPLRLLGSTGSWVHPIAIA